ncbi:hypothetical protein AVEN_49732-1 [Araneus ventricosus]|uniref:Uncharacterized protein n=1 Tax=Araneus ventricosus TaxID=182803 RepID=A0A4Y2FEZ2_ARAVE|nr:hypothetical protein AVEN_49732-1 [Araneus ventricosus]
MRETPWDVTACREEYIRIAPVSECVLLHCSFVSSASLESGDLSAIERAVIVVTSYLLTVCVVKYQKLTYSRPKVKSLLFDGQTSWTVFKTQFDVVSSANGWNNRVKASQLVASLRETAAEVLQERPSDKLTDLTTIDNALESRFGDSHLTQFYRTELKARRQKPSRISCRCGATNEPGLRRMPSRYPRQPSSPVLCRRYQR